MFNFFKKKEPLREPKAGEIYSSSYSCHFRVEKVKEGHVFYVQGNIRKCGFIALEVVGLNLSVKTIEKFLEDYKRIPDFV